MLNEQFSQKKVHKTYLAIVSNPPPAKSGELKNWLKKDPTNKKAEVVKGPQKEAAECKLFYRTLATKGQFILLEIVPHSGKFHQIRAQLSAAGCPILGDAKYGAQTAYLPESIALHAWKLDFKNPENADSVHIVATPPGNKFWNPFLEHF